MIVISPDAGGPIGEGYWNGYFNMEGWHYEDFFFKELIPTVEKEYRAGGSREQRAVAGLSMGGTFHESTVSGYVLFSYMVVMPITAFTIWGTLLKSSQVSQLSAFGFMGEYSVSCSLSNIENFVVSWVYESINIKSVQ